MADTLIEVFEESVRAFADRTVSEREGGAGKVRAFTYDEFARKSRGVAWQLAGLGVRPGDKVGVLSDNRPEWGIAFFGVLLAGAVVIPLDIHLKPAELANILSRAGARVCVAGAEADETLAEARPSAPALEHIVSMDDAGFGPAREDAPEIPPPGPDAVAVIPFSSGTTGVPKGVMLSQRNLASNVQSVLDLCIYETDGNLLSILPLHHTFELTVGFLTPFAKGVKVFYLNVISPRAISAALAKREITVCLVVPALVRLFHKNIFSQVQKQTGFRKVLFRVLFGVSRAGLGVGLRLGKVFFGPIRKRFGEGFRYFFSGGAALDSNVERDLRVLGLEVLQGYGLTETSPVTNVNPPGRNRIGSVGPAVPGVEVKLGPVEGAGPGEGEVLIRGPNVMLGYFENPEATAEVLVDGWFHTGDIGRLDGDGYLSICGRSKSVIVSEAGKNIYPEEVEDELMQSPYFQEVCVLGRKSEKGGEEVFAVIVPNEDAFKDRGETGREEKIIAREVKAASSRLADYKRVQKFAVVEQELPKTTTLKHKRPEIVKLLDEKGIW